MVNLSEVGCGGLYSVAVRGKNARIGGDKEGLWRVRMGRYATDFRLSIFT